MLGIYEVWIKKLVKNNTAERNSAFLCKKIFGKQQEDAWHPLLVHNLKKK